MDYILPDERKFLSTMIRVLEQDESELKKQLAQILKVSKLGFDPSCNFTRNKWNYYWLNVKLLVPLKYRSIFQKSTSKEILTETIEMILPPDCGYELYNIDIGVLLEEVDDTTILNNNLDDIDIPEIKEEEIRKYNLRYGCLIGHKSCAETIQIVERYNPKNVFLDISYDKRYVDFEEAIIDVLEVAELNPILAKDSIKSQTMLCKICSFIRTCKYGIADISFPSLNVAYELGVLQILNKATALFLFEGTSKPSDLAGLEHISYTSAKTLKPLLAKWLIDNVNEANKSALKKRFL